jgi:hypothetical protein
MEEPTAWDNAIARRATQAAASGAAAAGGRISQR